MKPKKLLSSQPGINLEVTGNNIMKNLEDIKTEIHHLNKKLDNVTTRLDILTDLLLPEEKPELVGYLQQTLDAIIKLDKYNKGLPISRSDLANELDVHQNTAYVRAEKLVQKKKLLKFYGRELDFAQFKEKKAVYYSLPRTLYNPDYLDKLEKENQEAHMISMTLLQEQPLSENKLVQNSKLTKKEIHRGLKYLLNRGLITKETKDNTVQFRIKKIEIE